ncbi:MAG: hypothetical protein IKT40_11965 [Bacilli bacterium]|nr:hypothetical protein [Bacilli bacterium]
MACEYCNNCQHATCHVIKSELYDERKNWYCGYNKTKVLIDLTTEKDALVSAPSWCPNKAKNEIKQITSASSTTSSDLFAPHTYRERLKNIKGFTTWDDIKVNEIYHLPPIFENGERKDIIVTSKTQYSIAYKVLNGSKYQLNTFYPSSIEVKFLVPHKIKKIELVNCGVR